MDENLHRRFNKRLKSVASFSQRHTWALLLPVTNVEEASTESVHPCQSNYNENNYAKKSNLSHTFMFSEIGVHRGNLRGTLCPWAHVLGLKPIVGPSQSEATALPTELLTVCTVVIITQKLAAVSLQSLELLWCHSRRAAVPFHWSWSHWPCNDLSQRDSVGEQYIQMCWDVCDIGDSEVVHYSADIANCI